MANSSPEERRTLVYATILYWQIRELSFLGRCIESLLAQDVGDATELRIILIDNGCGAEPSLPSSAVVDGVSVKDPPGVATVAVPLA